MDLSQISKKLKLLQYKSKAEFVTDLALIWENCLRYNSESSHFLRKNAKRFQKEVDRLAPLIPDVTVRDRAEVEAEERAEERRLRSQENGGPDGEGGDGEGEDSDDEPIIAARGRKAPGKTAKKGGSSTKPAGQEQDRTRDENATPVPELRNGVNGIAPGIRSELMRADSEMGHDGSQNGFSTPPPGAGSLTPAMNGLNDLASQSQAGDAMDIDSMSQVGHTTTNLSSADVDYDDPQYKLWKQVTKKDRAKVVADRHRLFLGCKLNPEEPALLRSKAGMRWWIRQQSDAEARGLLGKRRRDAHDAGGNNNSYDVRAGDGGMDKENGLLPEPTTADNVADGLAATIDDAAGAGEAVLPDYYAPLCAIPDLTRRLRWIEDSEGGVSPAGADETLRVVPPRWFGMVESGLTRKMGANVRQMQETRKICAKIGVVKQMQIQSQVSCHVTSL